MDDTAKKQYLEQAIKAPMSFLLKAIDIANDCDLKYKSSKNQRLLVELALMQLTSITFDGEKKKHKHFIIPAKNFISIPKSEREELPVKVAEPRNDYNEEKKAVISSTESKKESIEILEKPILKTERRRSSALSLNSIHKKTHYKKINCRSSYKY